MPRILVFQHVAAEPLGTLDPLIRRRGHRIRFVNFERHPHARPRIDRYAGLIVLGGPMNVEARVAYPHLDVEIAAIREAVAQDKPVLGICLGAQLLAHAFGGRVSRNPRWEIGWYPLTVSDAGRTDPVLSPLAPRSTVFQWHGCTFEPPPGAELLATGESCRHQAFRLGASAYGFQFHLEMDQRLIDRWLSLPAYRRELETHSEDAGAAEIHHQSQTALPRLADQAEQVFSAFLDLIGRPRRQIALPSR